MRVVILGCGSSAGVPMIGCDCAVCTSANPKNRRSRVSAYVEIEGIRLLIDSSPDLRQQALANDIRQVDAILYTHDHADHTHGIDELRSFNHLAGRVLPAYGDAATYHSIRSRFPYAFLPAKPEFGWFRPALDLIEITPYKTFAIGDARVLPIPQQHGRTISLGYRIGGFGYSTDVNHLEDAALEAMKGLDLWVVDCLRHDPAPTHAHLAKTLEWIEIVKPKRAILTHMGHQFDYDALRVELPAHVEPGWDGMEIIL